MLGTVVLFGFARHLFEVGDALQRLKAAGGLTKALLLLDKVLKVTCQYSSDLHSCSNVLLLVRQPLHNFGTSLDGLSHTNLLGCRQS